MPVTGAMRQDEAGPSKSTFLATVWALCTIFWSIFTPPLRTWAARILIFQPLWILRIYQHDGTWSQDLGLLLFLHAFYSYFTGAWRLPTLAELLSVDIYSEGFKIYVGVFGLLSVCGALAGGIVRRGRQLGSEVRNEHLFDRRIDDQWLPPLLIASRTSHSRMVPKRHSFGYSYLLVGIPVGISGRVSAALSMDGDVHSWFHVDSDDYLVRGHSELGLGQKLKDYLHSQGVSDREYAFAYLVTAPKFLGYSFNPASFWYIYDSDTVLKYMIVEVNNTFGERRMYLLKAEKAAADGKEPMANGGPVFTDTWRKDFHVSPFNSTNGSYSLKAIDPLAAYQDSGHVQIDNTITLRSSKEEAKIVARVWSQGPPQNAATISPLHLANFILSWCWVGFATFPRILWEASKLFFRRKLHVWYRPEVVETSLGRTYTTDEVILETFFRDFLKDVVSHADKPLRVIYEPAHAGGEEVVMYSQGFTYGEDHQRTLTIKVLSPAFYSRLVHYAHVKEAFDRECLATEEKNRTVVIRAPQLLPDLLEAVKQRRTTWTQTSRSSLQGVRWSMLRRLRCAPPAQSYGQIQDRDSEYTVSDIRSFQDSEFDRFVKHEEEHIGTYQRIVLKLFLARQFAFGVPGLISLADWMLRAAMLLAAMYYSSYATALDIFRPKAFEHGDISRSLLLLVLANSVHIWTFLKG